MSAISGVAGIYCSSPEGIRKLGPAVPTGTDGWFNVPRAPAAVVLAQLGSRTPRSDLVRAEMPWLALASCVGPEAHRKIEEFRLNDIILETEATRVFANRLYDCRACAWIDH
jgi:hypothetical protein